MTLSWADFPEGERAPEGSILFLRFPGWLELQHEMVVQGMTYEALHPYEDLPTWEEFGVPDDPDGTDEFRDWEEAVEPLLRRSDPQPPGLPWHKLNSPDGHVLARAEIRVGLAHASPDPITQTADDFATFWRD